MESKEIIEEVIKELEYCKKEDTMYEAETNLLLPDMEQVLKDLEVLEEIKKNHPDLYNLYKKMKEAESEWLDNGKN